MPRRLGPTAHLRPADNMIKAAEGSEIPIFGSMRLTFTLAGMPLYPDFLVTDSMDEVTLGVDWWQQMIALGELVTVMSPSGDAKSASKAVDR